MSGGCFYREYFAAVISLKWLCLVDVSVEEVLAMVLAVPLGRGRLVDISMPWENLLLWF